MDRSQTIVLLIYAKLKVAVFYLPTSEHKFLKPYLIIFTALFRINDNN